MWRAISRVTQGYTTTQSGCCAQCPIAAGKLGDARAIDELMPLLELQELNYLDYLEIRDAIEELGGEVKTEREFAGDEYYESMKNM